MSMRNATSELGSQAKKSITSADFVFYESYRKVKKIKKISATKLGKRPIYGFFLASWNQYFPLQCMLDFGSTSFVISPEAAKAFKISVAQQKKKVKSKVDTGRENETERLFTIPLGLAFGHHPS